MTPLFACILSNAASITCAVFAGLLAIRGQDHWLAFLVASILLSSSVTWNSVKKEGEE